MTPTLETVDAELARWRKRLAAASRNVTELSELPEFGTARAAAQGEGRLAEAARDLAATMDELWQGVLLIGGALDRAEQARRGGSRLWRGEEAARQAMEILQGPSLTVDLADTPVLHRRLLAGPRATVTVSPETLLQTMDAAFDRAREQLARIADAAARAAALRTRLAAIVAALPNATTLAAALEAADRPDPLDRLDALEALAPKLEAAREEDARARAELDAARRSLETLRADAATAESMIEAGRVAVAGTFVSVDTAGIGELDAWLDRIGHTRGSGGARASLVGLANWRELRERVGGDIRTARDTAAAALARRDDRVAMLGALRAKHRARTASVLSASTLDLDALASAAKAAMARTPVDLDAATRAINAYAAALARC